MCTSLESRACTSLERHACTSLASAAGLLLQYYWDYPLAYPLPTYNSSCTAGIFEAQTDLQVIRSVTLQTACIKLHTHANQVLSWYSPV